MFEFDAAALSAEQLIRILDSNPTRKLFGVRTGTWNAEQSVIFATRSYPFDLLFASPCPSDDGTLAFHDGGTAFVDSLQTRHSSFGCLHLLFYPNAMYFSRASITRIFEFENAFEALNVGYLDREIALLPLSAKVNTLTYAIYSQDVQAQDFDSVDIAANDLTLKIFIDETSEGWERLPTAFLDRVGASRHLHKLNLSVDIERAAIFAETLPVAAALVRVIHTNPQLTALHLNPSGGGHFGWTLHLHDVFEAMEDHPGLRTFAVSIDTTDPFDYSSQERLLSRNRIIAVCDCDGEKITNGSRIDNIYALNRFYHGSALLVKESTALRPQLVTATLTERVPGNVPYTALLMSNHTDVLCELVVGLNLDYMTEETISSVSVPTHRSSKRKRTRIQPSRVAKKAT